MQTTHYTTAPGPKSNRPLGHLHQLQQDPIGLFMDAFEQHGDVVQLRLGPHRVHLINHPDNIKHVLLDNHTNYTKGVGYDQMRLLVGNGLVANDGQSWLRNHRLIQPAFHRQKVEGFAGCIAAHTAAMLDHWAKAADEPIELTAELSKLVYAIVGDVLYSSDLDTREAMEASAAVRLAVDLIYQRVGAIVPLPLAIPTSENRRLSRAIGLLHRIMDQLIAKRRASAEHRPDFLGMLLDARDQDTNEALSDRQIRDELMNFTEAALDTTTAALSWTFYLLSHSPDVDRRLATELERELSGRTPKTEDLPRLSCASRVLEEAMRLFPPGWVIGRAATDDDVIGGYRIPAGSNVLMSPFVAHRDPRFWENPEGFDPERFAAEQVAQRPRFAYFPFGGGPRICIGKGLAMMEMQIILAMVCQRFRLELKPGMRIGLAPKLTLVPRNPVWVTLRPRVAQTQNAAVRPRSKLASLAV